jgi:predicted nucleic acid-binding protein
VLPFDRASARVYAQLRTDKTLKAPDAIQLACAAAAGCDLFITNDDRLSRRIIPGIQFIVSLEAAFL